MIQRDIGRLRVIEHAIPVRRRLEGIVIGDEQARLRARSLLSPRVPSGVVTVDIELPCGAQQLSVQVTRGFVQDLERGHNTVVLRVTKLLREALNRGF